MKLVSIITVNFNHSFLTEELLTSINSTNDYKNIEIIVVDNGSIENPIPKWKNIYPDVKFIRSEINLGFAGGNNIGINAAKGEYLFLVNNDTEFTIGLIKTLVSLLEKNNRIGVVSPKIRYFDAKDVLQYAGFTNMDFKTARNKCIGLKEIDTGKYDHLTGPTGYAHGAAMMVSREAIEKAGLMAENFFLYYEELDWFERIKRAGFEIWVCMSALIYHKESMSVGKNSPIKEYYMNRNRILFVRKNTTIINRIIFYVYFLVVVTPRNLIKYMKEKEFSFIPLLFKAILWNFRNNINSNKK